jgi:hypothetical protein
VKFFDLLSTLCPYYQFLHRAVYEELGKYGSIENQLLCRQRIEEVEPMIDFCSHKLGGSSLQAHELLDTANDLLKAKMEVFSCLIAYLTYLDVFLRTSPGANILLQSTIKNNSG